MANLLRGCIVQHGVQRPASTRTNSVIVAIPSCQFSSTVLPDALLSALPRYMRLKISLYISPLPIENAFPSS